jgi:hypothetical protein
MKSPELRAVRDDISIMTWRNLLVGVWTDRPTFGGVAELRSQFESMHVQCPAGFACCIIVEKDISGPLPEEAVRNAIAELNKEFQNDLLGLCGVQEASGFRGAAIRSVFTALLIMSRMPCKTTTVATTREAADWLAPLLKHTLSPGEILAAIQQFRADAEAKRTSKAARSG